jgi:hypothetical protein
MDITIYTILMFLVMVFAGSLVVFSIIRLFRLPEGERMAQIKSWLLWAVTEAEIELGEKTGKLKLSLVYGAFVEKFPWLAKIVPVSLFSSLVDEALLEMRRLLTTNTVVNTMVYGDEETK